MPVTATVVNSRTGRVARRVCSTAEEAAGSLAVLLRAAGWERSQEETVALLLRRPITFNGFVYSVDS